MKKSDNYKKWILFAESDLAIAKAGKHSKEILYETLCFHCQQVSEKSIKAVLVFYSIDFPKTHDIEFLLKFLKKKQIAIPKLVEESKVLSQYAVMSRYPGEEMEVDKKEYKKVLKISSIVLKWAKSVIEKNNDKLF